MKRKFLFTTTLFTFSAAYVSAEQLTDYNTFIKNGNLITANTNNATERAILIRAVRIYNDEGYLCSGTQVLDGAGNPVVITAAHCALNMGNLKKEAGVSITDRTKVVSAAKLTVYQMYTEPNRFSRSYKVQHVYVHPDAFKNVGLLGNGMLNIPADGNNINDVAILSLPRESLRAIPQTTLAAMPYTSKSKVIIAGYGANDGKIGDSGTVSNFGTADYLRYGVVQISTKVGQTLELGSYTSSSGMPLLWSTTCQGDSGGPTFSIINGVVILIGITSFGPSQPSGCPNNGQASSVMDVSQFNLWLKQNYSNSNLNN